MILYYITDRRQFAGTEAEQRRLLLAKIAEATRAGVDYIQLREKDLSVRALEGLAREAVRIVRGESAQTRLLINSRTDVAMAVGADGVHLTSDDIAASDARAIFGAAEMKAIIGVSCHSAEEVQRASSHGADFAVLAPIFGKAQTGAPGIGLDELRSATGVNRKPDLRVEAGDRREGIPVLALGGVTVENARACIGAGAAGVAGIRLFQENVIAKIKF